MWVEPRALVQGCAMRSYAGHARFVTKRLCGSAKAKERLPCSDSPSLPERKIPVREFAEVTCHPPHPAVSFAIDLPRRWWP